MPIEVRLATVSSGKMVTYPREASKSLAGPGVTSWGSRLQFIQIPGTFAPGPRRFLPISFWISPAGDYLPHAQFSNI
jgi:hypothetical protein